MSRALGRLRALAVGLVLLVVLAGGAYAAGFLGAPSVGGVENRFAGVNQTTTLVVTEVTVSNPNPVGVDLGGLGIGYTVRMNDVPMAEGSKQGLSVESGSSTLTFTTAMDNERIPAWWVTHIRNGEHTRLRVEANVTSGLLGRSAEVTPVDRSIDTDVLSGFNSTETRPVNANSPLVSDPVLYVNETSASWGDVSTSTTPMDLTFVVYNPKPAPYTVTEIGYTITMNDVAVGEGETDREHVIEPRSRERIEATTAIRNQRLDEWWVTHLERDQVTELRIEFVATVELPSGQTVEVPLDALTYTETIETDFFGNKAAGDGGTEGAGTATSTPGESESTAATGATSTQGDDASDGSDATATDDGPTPSPTSTASPTPTPTDDGGLLG